MSAIFRRAAGLAAVLRQGAGRVCRTCLGIRRRTHAGTGILGSIHHAGRQPP